MVVTMTCSTATDCLCHIWSRIFFLQPSQSPPSSFMNYRQVWIITRWLTWVTRRMPLVEQELIIHRYVINCSIVSFLWCVCRSMFGVVFFLFSFFHCIPSISRFWVHLLAFVSHSWYTILVLFYFYIGCIKLVAELSRIVGSEFKVWPRS